MSKELKLWYQQPAVIWTDALPVGNGRIGGMVFGGIAEERIGLNEDSLWSGYPQDKNNHGAQKHYKKAQELAREGRFEELQALIEGNMLGDFTESFLPLGNLQLQHTNLVGEASGYYRDLSLNRAVATTRFTVGGVTYLREVLVSHPANALIVRISASTLGSVALAVSLTSPLRAMSAVSGDCVTLEGLCPSHVEPSYLKSENPVVYEDADSKKGIRFRGILQVKNQGGTLRQGDGKLFVDGADEVLLVFVARTSFNGYDKHPYLDGKEYQNAAKADLEALSGCTYENLLAAHIKDHQHYFNRMDFSVTGEGDDIPTDERLRQHTKGQRDYRLWELLFQYGRYLTIASSREETHAANLQGIWNEEMRAPWSGNYTININTEMNYWPTESCNLSELHQPLFRLIENLRKTGGQTARIHYGARGAVSHHNTDIWCIANPVGRSHHGSSCWGPWNMSFGWLCEHLYEHYCYTLDGEFLEKVAYPAIKDAALYYLDLLSEGKNGYLMITPSTSPENRFLCGNGKNSPQAETTTMTTAIIKEVFDNLTACGKILGVDKELLAEIAEKRARLMPYQIGSKGQLMEWSEDYEDYEVAHRHISHLYPLHPGREISPEKTPELANACKRSLEIRGDEGTGWSLGWKISTWARLLEGDHAAKLIDRQLHYVDTSGFEYQTGGGTYLNMFGAHPPFQIDGNFAAPAGIAQLFLQCDTDSVTLLPAIPRDLPNGHIHGLCAMNGLEVDLDFAGGKLKKAVVRGRKTVEREIAVRYDGKVYPFCPKAGEELVIE